MKGSMSTLKVMLIIFLTSFSHLAWSGGLERLFTTAQERHALEIRRISPPKPPPPSSPTDEEAAGNKISLPSPTLPEQIVFNGLIVRNQGSSTAWVNGSEGLFQDNFRVELERREGVSVPIIFSKNEIWLKPGQTMSTAEGKVLESYESRSSIQPPK